MFCRMNWLACLLVVSMVALLNCSKSAKNSGDVLATVDGVKITQADVDNTLERLPPHARSFYQTPQAKKQLVESLVTSELLYQQALKRKVDRLPEVTSQIDAAKRGIYARYLIEEIVKERTTEAALKDQ